MPAYNAALLHHLTRAGSHYDLLLPALPIDSTPDHRLTAFRCTRPSHAWTPRQSTLLTHLPPHRQHYLTHQGPIDPNRGRVRRVDQGHARAIAQSHHHAVFDLRFQHFRGRLHLSGATVCGMMSTSVLLCVLLSLPTLRMKEVFF
ncbi:MAG: hypothetical protein ACYTGQ_03945 [Planctomycetota bacterium]